MRCVNCGHKLIYRLDVENGRKELVHAYGGRVCEEMNYEQGRICGCSQPVEEVVNVKTAKQDKKPSVSGKKKKRRKKK